MYNTSNEYNGNNYWDHIEKSTIIVKKNYENKNKNGYKLGYTAIVVQCYYMRIIMTIQRNW